MSQVTIPFAPNANPAARWETVGKSRVIFGTVKLSESPEFGKPARDKAQEVINRAQRGAE